MAGFSMDKVFNSVKRRAPSPPLPLAEQSSRKIPKVSDLTVVQGPRPRPPRRPAATGDVVVCLYKYPLCNRNFNFSLRDVPDSLGECSRTYFQRVVRNARPTSFQLYGAKVRRRCASGLGRRRGACYAALAGDYSSQGGIRHRTRCCGRGGGGLPPAPHFLLMPGVTKIKSWPAGSDRGRSPYSVTQDVSVRLGAIAEKTLLPEVQIQHEVHDSLCVNIKDRWNSFLAQHPETPDTAYELERQAWIKLVVTDNNDPDKLGTFQCWRPAFQSRVAPLRHIGGRLWVRIRPKSIPG